MPKIIAEAVLERVRSGKRFSIIAISEGALSVKDQKKLNKLFKDKKNSPDSKDKEKTQSRLRKFQAEQSNRSVWLAQKLEKLTGLESRVTILGYVQRGGTPSAYDRLLATNLGTAAAAVIEKGESGVMVAVQGEDIRSVPLEQVVGKRRTVPLDHLWLKTARRVGTCLGDK